MENSWKIDVCTYGVQFQCSYCIRIYSKIHQRSINVYESFFVYAMLV